MQGGCVKTRRCIISQPAEARLDPLVKAAAQLHPVAIACSTCMMCKAPPTHLVLAQAAGADGAVVEAGHVDAAARDPGESILARVAADVERRLDL